MSIPYQLLRREDKLSVNNRGTQSCNPSGIRQGFTKMQTEDGIPDYENYDPPDLEIIRKIYQQHWQTAQLLTQRAKRALPNDNLSEVRWLLQRNLVACEQLRNVCEAVFRAPVADEHSMLERPDYEYSPMKRSLSFETFQDLSAWIDSYIEEHYPHLSSRKD